MKERRVSIIENKRKRIHKNKEAARMRKRNDQKRQDI